VGAAAIGTIIIGIDIAVASARRCERQASAYNDHRSSCPLSARAAERGHIKKSLWARVSKMHSSDAFDLNATLSRLDGDRVLFRELIGFYLEDSPKVLEQLKAAVRDGNASAIERAAHGLKGLTANVGSGPASLVAARIEDSARTKDLTTAAAALSELEQELACLSKALEEFRATPEPRRD
jgi:HPt (histidine-containing phosphotransfer) domain-containing protein